MSFCPSCGASNADGAKFCEKCGVTITEEAPAAPVAAPGASVVDQASQAISGGAKAAGKALGGLDVPKLILTGVVIIALIVGYVLFLKPMSESDYENKADDYSLDMTDAQGEMDSALSDYYELTDLNSDDDVDKTDIEDLRAIYDESRKASKEAASGIKGLRPPKTYKAADERLNEWAKYYSGDHWVAVDELLTEAEGRSYGRFSESISKHYDDTSRDASRANRSMSRAAEDLGLTWGYGE